MFGLLAYACKHSSADSAVQYIEPRSSNGIEMDHGDHVAHGHLMTLVSHLNIFRCRDLGQDRSKSGTRHSWSVEAGLTFLMDLETPNPLPKA